MGIVLEIILAGFLNAKCQTCSVVTLSCVLPVVAAKEEHVWGVCMNSLHIHMLQSVAYVACSP